MQSLSIVLEKLESRKQANLKNYGEKHMTIPEAKRTARIIEWRQLISPQKNPALFFGCRANGRFVLIDRFAAAWAGSDFASKRFFVENWLLS